MQSNYLKHFEDSGPGGICSPPRGRSGHPASSGQSDCGSDQHQPARRLVGAHVGLQLRRGGSRFDCDLRQAQPGGERMVARGDHGSHGAEPQDQPDKQSVLWGRRR